MTPVISRGAGTSDGRIYRRIEQKPPPELSALLKRLAPQTP